MNKFFKAFSLGLIGAGVGIATMMAAPAPSHACNYYTDGPMCSPIFSGNWNNGPVCNSYRVDQFGRRVCATEFGNPHSGTASMPSSGFNNGTY